MLTPEVAMIAADKNSWKICDMLEAKATQSFLRRYWLLMTFAGISFLASMNKVEFGANNTQLILTESLTNVLSGLLYFLTLVIMYELFTLAHIYYLSMWNAAYKAAADALRAENSENK